MRINCNPNTNLHIDIVTKLFHQMGLPMYKKEDDVCEEKSCISSTFDGATRPLAMLVTSYS